VVVGVELGVIDELKELLLEAATEELPVEGWNLGVEEATGVEGTVVDERATLLGGELPQLPDPDPPLSLPRIKAVASTP